MSAEKNWTDDELIGFIWDFRIANGACTLGDLRKATGMAKSGLQKRVHALRDAGQLVTSATPGSLRCADERLMRELADGRLVEMTGARQPS